MKKKERVKNKGKKKTQKFPCGRFGETINASEKTRYLKD